MPAGLAFPPVPWILGVLIVEAHAIWANPIQNSVLHNIMVYRFILPFASVSKKNSRPIFKNKKTGRPFLGKSKRLEQFEESALLFLTTQKNAQGLKEPISVPCCLRATFWFKDKRMRDADNQLNTIKDSLQAAGVIKNDYLFTIGSWEMKFGMPQDKVDVSIVVQTEGVSHGKVD